MKFEINYSMKLIKLKVGKYLFNKNNKLLYVIFSNLKKHLIIKLFRTLNLF